MTQRVIKLTEREELGKEAEIQLSPQRKRPEVHRFLLQVDRQTKGSYPTMEGAEAAGLLIKKHHPVVQVSVYDSVETSNKLIGLFRALSLPSAPFSYWALFSAGEYLRGCLWRWEERLALAEGLTARTGS